MKAPLIEHHACQAAYHGVPVVGIPMLADQLDNVMKAVYRGFGLAIKPPHGLNEYAIQVRCLSLC